MISKVDKNYFLDIVLGIIGLVCAITGLIIDFKPQEFSAVVGMVKHLHIWSGYAVIVLVSIHLLWHFSWLEVMTKSIAKVRKKRLAAAFCIAMAIIFCVGVAMNSPVKKPPGQGKAITESLPKISEKN